MRASAARGAPRRRSSTRKPMIHVAYDAGKKSNGRERHALVNMDGRALLLEPRPACIQDCHGGGRRHAPRVYSIDSSRRSSPMVATITSGSRNPRTSSSRSCAKSPITSASWSCRAGGWRTDVQYRQHCRFRIVVASSSGRPEVAGSAGWRPTSAMERVDLSRAISNQ